MPSTRNISVEFTDADTAQEVYRLDTEPIQLSVHPQLWGKWSLGSEDNIDDIMSFINLCMQVDSKFTMDHVKN